MLTRFFKTLFYFLFGKLKPSAYYQYIADLRLINKYREDYIVVLKKERDRLQQEIKEVKNNSMELLIKAHNEGCKLEKATEQLQSLVKDQSNCIKRLECQLQQKVSLSMPFMQLKKCWLDFAIERINQSTFGCGLVYELYIERKQAAIENLLLDNEAMLSQDEIAYIKSKTDYTENFKPYEEYYEETGQMLSGLALAHKIAYGL